MALASAEGPTIVSYIAAKASHVVNVASSKSCAHTFNFNFNFIRLDNSKKSNMSKLQLLYVLYTGLQDKHKTRNCSHNL